MEHGVGRILDVFLVSFAIKIALLLGDFLQKARPWQHHIHLAISDQCLGAVLVSFGRRLGVVGVAARRLFYFYIFRKYFLQKYIFNITIYSFVPLPPSSGAAGTYM